jgi:hypothetical protein
MWSQDLNFRPRFSSARRQPIVAFSVFCADVRPTGHNRPSKTRQLLFRQDECAASRPVIWFSDVGSL